MLEVVPSLNGQPYDVQGQLSDDLWLFTATFSFQLGDLLKRHTMASVRRAEIEMYGAGLNVWETSVPLLQ